MQHSRRTFLKVGALSALAIAAGGGIWRATHPAPLRPFAIAGGARDALAAIVPAILGPMLPADPAARASAVANAIEGVNTAILGLPLHAQKEIADLFGLLALGPARRLLAGVPDDWPQAKPADVAAFLDSWRLHRIRAIRPAYYALHDLAYGAWYANPSSWEAIGYPGPMKELSL